MNLYLQGRVKIYIVTNIIFRREDMFPDDKTQDRIFNGVPFKMIPICNIRVSKNNTHIRLGDADSKLFASILVDFQLDR